jgi:hypothetical protein
MSDEVGTLRNELNNLDEFRSESENTKAESLSLKEHYEAKLANLNENHELLLKQFKEEKTILVSYQFSIIF